MAQKTIEIEKKFLMQPDLPEKLTEEGAVLVSEKEFSDSYFDFLDNTLSFQNCWLRKRDDIWELKYLENGPVKRSLIDSYRELNNKKKILEVLSKYSPKSSKVFDNVNEFVSTFGLQVLASFKTTRTKYRIDGIVVDLDIASFGYSVGEIEIMVSSEKEIPDAEKKLESLAKKLGINWGESYRGKLDEFLWRNKPTLYTQLVDKEILRKQSY